MSYRNRIVRLLGLTALSCAVGLGATTTPVLGQEETVALRGGRLLTITDGVIDDGVLIMRRGRITAIGSQVRIPSDARVIDVTGKTVMPGLIDGFTNLGVVDYPSYGEDDDEATDPVMPHMRIIDAFNPANRFIPFARSAGVTAVLCAPAEGNLLTGQSALVRLAGTSIEEMVAVSPVGVHLSLGEASKLRYAEKRRMPATRMGSAALLRQTLLDARGYADKVAAHERKIAAHEAGDSAGEGSGEPTPPVRDLKLEALLQVLSGRVPLIVSADRFDDIHTALRIAAEFDVRIILNHGAEAHRLAVELAGQDIPVIWGPADARYRELESQEGRSETPGLLARAGVRVAFQTGSVEDVTGLLAQARTAVAHGLSREEALKGLTLYPAEAFGAGDELGSLEVGKMADVVVFDGDPLSELSKAEMVFVGGRRF